MSLRSADQDFAAHLVRLLPELALALPEPRYLQEPRGRWRGQGGLLARPESVTQIAMLLRACNEARVPVVPYGGAPGWSVGRSWKAAPPR